MKNKSHYTAYFNRFCLRLPIECIQDCIGPGQNDAQVTYWADKLETEIQTKITPDKIRLELKEYGAWTQEELLNTRDNIERIIWIAAGNIAEESYNEL